MITIPNVISLLRLPLAVLFLFGSPFFRTFAIITALISDGVDGLFARRYKQVSKLGTFLDPLTDKLFVMTVLGFFISEGRITLMESAVFICRDFSVLLFGVYLLLTGNFSRYKFRAIWCGKISTILQFIVLLALNANVPIPSYLYSVFIMLGVLALAELYFVDHTTAPPKLVKPARKAR